MEAQVEISRCIYSGKEMRQVHLVVAVVLVLMFIGVPLLVPKHGREALFGIHVVDGRMNNIIRQILDGHSVNDRSSSSLYSVFPSCDPRDGL